MRKKSEETARRILNAAFQCISLNGCSNTGLREVASIAGVAMSQVNYYFTNREGLFTAVLEMMQTQYIEGLHESLAPCQSQSDRLSAVTAYNEQLLINNRDLYVTFLDFFGVSLWSPSFKAHMKDFFSQIGSAINSELKQVAVDSNRLTEKDPEALTTLILASSFGLAMQYLINDEKEEMHRSFELMRLAIQLGRDIPIKLT